MNIVSGLTPVDTDNRQPGLVYNSITRTPRILGLFKARGYLIDTVIDEQRITLPFRAKEDLQRFCRFVSIYVNENAPGNSYGGYFPAWGSKPRAALFAPAAVTIENDRLIDMVRRICHKRLMLPYYESAPPDCLKAAPKCFLDGSWFRFEFDEAALPPRLSAQGFADFVRVVDDSQYRRVDAYFIAPFEDKAILFIPDPGESVVTNSLIVVPQSHVMRIRDYYRDSSSWRDEHGEKLDRQLKEAREYVLQRINGQQNLAI